MFWRFLIAMFCASSVGMSAFIVVLHVVDGARTRAALASQAFAAHTRQSFDAAAPLLRFAARDAAGCEQALRLVLPALFAAGSLPKEGANSLEHLAADGRAGVRYTDGAGAACSWPRGSFDATQPGTGAFSATLSGAAPGERLAYRVRLHGPLDALAHAPGAAWTLGFSCVALLNLLCALTLVPLLVRRIRRAQRAARAWTQGDTRMRIDDPVRDEFGDLTRSFNRLAASFAEVIRVKQHLAAADERNRLARELHDTAKQRAFALSLQLTALKSKAAQEPERRERIVATALTLVCQLQSDLAGVIQRLSGSTVAELGMRALLREEAPALLDGAAIGWGVEVPDAVDAALREAPELAQQLLLIAIEAVANAREHARARHIAIALSDAGEGGYRLEIRDDGRGFDVANPARLGMGLANMRTRARSLPRGEFAISSSPDGGTRIAVSFALAAQAVAA